MFYPEKRNNFNLGQLLAEPITQPIAAMLCHSNGQLCNHVFLIYQDRIYDPEMRLALRLNKHNLDKLGGPGAKFCHLLEPHVLENRAGPTQTPKKRSRKRKGREERG